MLNVKNLFRLHERRGFGQSDASPKPRSKWTMPHIALKIDPSPASRAAFSLLAEQTGLDLDDFIQMRLERWTRERGHRSMANNWFNVSYRSDPEEPRSEINAMYRLVYDELHDQSWLDHREADTARPFLFLAVCMWRLGDLDRTASAATLAEQAYRVRGVEMTTDHDCLNVARGLHALGMFYWGIELGDDLRAAETLGDSWDEVLGGQFSVQILQALARLEEMRGNHFHAQRLTSRANSLMWSSAAEKLPPPVWQVRIAPGGSYAISGLPKPAIH